jgi:type II secretory pathway pseudopilin PulG
MKGSYRAGFTLLHMTLLLAVMTLLACIAIPGWFSRSDITLDNAVQLLVRDMSDAQDRAAFQHRTLQLQFDADGDGYTITDARGRSIAAPVGTGPFTRRYSTDAVFRGVSVKALELGPENALHFGPRGMTLNGGRLVLAFQGEERVIQVQPNSGNVRVDGEPYRAR